MHQIRRRLFHVHHTDLLTARRPILLQEQRRNHRTLLERPPHHPSVLVTPRQLQPQQPRLDEFLVLRHTHTLRHTRKCIYTRVNSHHPSQQLGSQRQHPSHRPRRRPLPLQPIGDAVTVCIFFCRIQPSTRLLDDHPQLPDEPPLLPQQRHHCGTTTRPLHDPQYSLLHLPRVLRHVPKTHIDKSPQPQHLARHRLLQRVQIHTTRLHQPHEQPHVPHPRRRPRQIPRRPQPARVQPVAPAHRRVHQPASLHLGRQPDGRRRGAANQGRQGEIQGGEHQIDGIVLVRRRRRRRGRERGRGRGTGVVTAECVLQHAQSTAHLGPVPTAQERVQHAHPLRRTQQLSRCT